MRTASMIVVCLLFVACASQHAIAPEVGPAKWMHLKASDLIPDPVSILTAIEIFGL